MRRSSWARTTASTEPPPGTSSGSGRTPSSAPGLAVTRAHPPPDLQPTRQMQRPGSCAERVPRPWPARDPPLRGHGQEPAQDWRPALPRTPGSPPAQRCRSPRGPHSPSGRAGRRCRSGQPTCRRARWPSTRAPAPLRPTPRAAPRSAAAAVQRRIPSRDPQTTRALADSPAVQPSPRSGIGVQTATRSLRPPGRAARAHVEMQPTPRGAAARLRSGHSLQDLPGPARSPCIGRVRASA